MSTQRPDERLAARVAGRRLKAAPARLRAAVASGHQGVDREAGIIRGMVMAQAGPFKSEGRGEFDLAGLRKIVELTNARPKGLRSSFAHETLSSDGLGRHLGRVRDARMGTATVERGGKLVKVPAARGDLHFDPTAFRTPEGDLAGYVMDLAESDPDAVSSSLVLEREEVWRLDGQGRPLEGPDGLPLPPIWVPTRLFASDVVSVGDAVDGLLSAGLSADSLPDAVVRQATHLLDRVLPGQPPEVIRSRLVAWLDRYLSQRFPARQTPRLDAARARLARLEVP